MGDDLKTIKLVAAQVNSVFLDRDASVDKACDFIREAGTQGADIIGFPEGFIPAHPAWYGYQPANGGKSIPLAQELFKNAVEIPGPATVKLGQACRDANITAVIGICEKYPNTTGTMFNTQVFIGPDGTVLGKHQKLVATVGERLVHTGGYGDTLTAFYAPFGTMSELICGENSNPLAVYVMMAMHTMVHVAAWPPHFGGRRAMQKDILAITPGLAYSLGAFVINTAGTVTDELIDLYAATDEDREHLASLKDVGTASIIAPSGDVIAKTVSGGDQLLYADADLNQVFGAKLVHDYAGHYNRFDIFNFSVNRNAPKPLNLENEASPIDQENTSGAARPHFEVLEGGGE